MLMEWYFGFGLLLWIIAQVTGADETKGVLNNLCGLLMFVVLWPVTLITILTEIKKR